jgi:predicted SAM-dependent methyltransferase
VDLSALVRGVGRSAALAAFRFVEPRLSRPACRALRQVRNELYLQRVHRAAVKRAAALPRTEPLRLNLGSGFHSKPGWINVDLIDSPSTLQLDLREPLPFDDGSASDIYTEHFFEHLSYAPDPPADETDDSSFARALLRECRRVLVPGGRLDIVVPDAEAILQAYAARGVRPFLREDWWAPAWCDTPMHLVNYLFRQGSEHQYAYDLETLQRVLEGEGFVRVARRRFDARLDSRNPTRSLFVVAYAPEAAHGPA